MSKLQHIEKLCNLSEELQASDIILHAGMPPVLKVHGQLTQPEQIPLTPEELNTFWSACGASDSATDYDTSFVSSSGVRFRVNLLQQMGQRAAVLRRVKANVPTFEELGLPGELLTEWITRPAGIVIVSGRTGSGKSTTLAACLEWINLHQHRHIITIEDPVEYVFTPKGSIFTQREIGVDTPGFAEGLRRALRQCPDVILVGEIRDKDTAETALQAAETGHLVLTTVHASSAAESVERLQTLFAGSGTERFLRFFSEVLIGIFCQQLLPAREGGMVLVPEYFTSEGVIPKLIAEGRIPEIADAIHRADVRRARSFASSLIDLVKAARIDENTALNHAADPHSLKRSLRGIHAGISVRH